MNTQTLPVLVAERDASADQPLVEPGCELAPTVMRYAAAELYALPSRLSDTELGHRRLARDTLTRDICDLSERPHQE